MTFEEWLTDEMDNAEREEEASHKIAVNSYGAGYASGYATALRIISKKMTPELSRVSVE